MKHKYYYSILLLLFGFSSFCQTLDQVNAPSDNGGGGFTVSPSQDVGQSFTAGMTGDLSQINIRVGNFGSVFVAGDFQLRIIDGNGYSGAVLNTTTFSISSAPATNSYDELIIVLSSTVPITSGNIYTIDLKGITGSVTTQGTNPNYTNGGLYFNNGYNGLYNNYDLWFKTFVNTPTPATHLNFDGSNDAVTVTGVNFPLGNTSRTIEAWIKTTQNNGGGAIMTYGNLTTNNRFALYQTGGKLNFVAENNDYNTNITINDGNWHHVAATHDGTSLKVYLDGVQVGTSQAKTFNTTGNQFSIGYRGVASEYFNGSIDEIRVWSLARTAEQIAGSMNCELQGSESGLVAYYRMNQGIDQANNTTETTLTDATSNGYDGTLTNFTLTSTTSNWLAGSIVDTGSTVPSAPIVASPVAYTQNDVAIALTATTGGAGLLWYTTATGGTGSLTAPTPDTSSAGSTSYWVSSANANGCESEREEIIVNVNATTPATHLNFDGINDYVEIPKPITSDFTIEYWVKTTSTGTTGAQWYMGHSIVDNETGGVTTDFGTSLNGSKLAFGIGNPDTTILSTSDINNGAWNHVAVTWSQSTGLMQIYINGTLENSTTASTAARTANDFIKIGSSNNFGSYFNGSIDELRIWDSVLTQADIAATKDCELQASQTGIVAYYKFNQGFDNTDNSSVTTLVDEIGSNNGTLTNFALMGTTSNWQSGSIVTTGDTCTALSNSSFESISSLKVYPNPSTGIFNISTQEDVTIEVYDIIGKVIVKQKVSNGLDSIDISSFNSGIYLLKATNTSGNVNTYKIVKQ